MMPDIARLANGSSGRSAEVKPVEIGAYDSQAGDWPWGSMTTPQVCVPLRTCPRRESYDDA